MKLDIIELKDTHIVSTLHYSGISSTKLQPDLH